MRPSLACHGRRSSWPYMRRRSAVTLPRRATRNSALRDREPGSIAAAVAGYFGSARLLWSCQSTRVTRRRILERFRSDHGDKGIATLGRPHVERMVDAKAAMPGTALNFIVALRGLMRHASTAVGLRADDPTAGVRGPRNSAPQASIRGRNWTSRHSRPSIRLAREPGLLSPCCCIQRNDGPTLSCLADNTCATGCCSSGRARPGPADHSAPSRTASGAPTPRQPRT